MPHSHINNNNHQADTYSKRSISQQQQQKEQEDDSHMSIESIDGSVLTNSPPSSSKKRIFDLEEQNKLIPLLQLQIQSLKDERKNLLHQLEATRASSASSTSSQGQSQQQQPVAHHFQVHRVSPVSLSSMKLNTNVNAMRSVGINTTMIFNRDAATMSDKKVHVNSSTSTDFRLACDGNDRLYSEKDLKKTVEMVHAKMRRAMVSVGIQHTEEKKLQRDVGVEAIASVKNSSSATDDVHLMLSAIEGITIEPEMQDSATGSTLSLKDLSKAPVTRNNMTQTNQGSVNHQSVQATPYGHHKCTDSVDLVRTINRATGTEMIYKKDQNCHTADLIKVNNVSVNTVPEPVVIKRTTASNTDMKNVKSVGVNVEIGGSTINLGSIEEFSKSNDGILRGIDSKSGSYTGIEVRSSPGSLFDYKTSGNLQFGDKFNSLLAKTRSSKSKSPENQSTVTSESVFRSIEQLRRSKSPGDREYNTLSTFNRESRSKSPEKLRSMSKSPGKREIRSISPENQFEQSSWGKSPDNIKTIPSESMFRSIDQFRRSNTPGDDDSMSKSSNEPNSRSISPEKRDSRSKSPVDNLRRPMNQFERSESPENRLRRTENQSLWTKSSLAPSESVFKPLDQFRRSESPENLLRTFKAQENQFRRSKSPEYHSLGYKSKHFESEISEKSSPDQRLPPNAQFSPSTDFKIITSGPSTIKQSQIKQPSTKFSLSSLIRPTNDENDQLLRLSMDKTIISSIEPSSVLQSHIPTIKSPSSAGKTTKFTFGGEKSEQIISKIPRPSPNPTRKYVRQETFTVTTSPPSSINSTSVADEFRKSLKRSEIDECPAERMLK